MNADSLELPAVDGGYLVHARYIDGAREIVHSRISSDDYAIRWDTVINGDQVYVFKKFPNPTHLDWQERADKMRVAALEHFRMLESDG